MAKFIYNETDEEKVIRLLKKDFEKEMGLTFESFLNIYNNPHLLTDNLHVVLSVFEYTFNDDLEDDENVISMLETNLECCTGISYEQFKNAYETILENYPEKLI